MRIGETTVRQRPAAHRYKPTWQILLVSDNDDRYSGHVRPRNDPMEFFSGFFDSFVIVAVDDEDESIGALIVVLPETTNLLLTADLNEREISIVAKSP